LVWFGFVAAGQQGSNCTENAELQVARKIFIMVA
jgi:hypothetical protein